MTYSEKLKNPRWQKKRLEILSRDNFTCTRCQSSNKTLHVHHCNGYRTGAEPWEYDASELKTLCCDCHTLAHEPRSGLTIYLAGKIAHTCWRHSIVEGLRSSSPESICGGSSGAFPEMLPFAIFSKHHYSGPFFVSCDHGCFHGKNQHGSAPTDAIFSEHGDEIVMFLPNAAEQQGAFRRAVQGIMRCDLFFAWIESLDCYGTIAEIGIAYNSGKTVCIGLKEGEDFSDLWFVTSCAQFINVAKTPEEALEISISDIQNTIK